MMAYMDPADMSPDQRFAELAAILVSGFLRLKRRTPYLADGQIGIAGLIAALWAAAQTCFIRAGISNSVQRIQDQ